MVVAVDGSASASNALAWAASLAGHLSLHLTLVHVEKGRAHDRAVQVLELHRRELHEAGFREPVETVILADGQIEQLLERAHAAFMLVVGRSQERGIATLTSFGRVLARRSDMPVAVVPEDWEVWKADSRDIVVGVSARESGVDALSFAFDLASALDSGLTALHAWQVPDPYSWEHGLDDLAQGEAEEQRITAETLAGWQEKYPDVEVDERVERGPAVDLLLEASRSAQLIVLGGRPHGGVTDIVLGSIARPVLHHAACPVVVVHQAES
jgi:nucleotide-binding universal stress UspA family protein